MVCLMTEYMYFVPQFKTYSLRFLFSLEKVELAVQLLSYDFSGDWSAADRSFSILTRMLLQNLRREGW